MQIPEQCRRQSGWCRNLGSPLYAALLRNVADDYAAGGPSRSLLAPHAEDPPGWALPLRLMGAVHRLVLSGKAPQLSPFYPSVGGIPELDSAWHSFRLLLQQEQTTVAQLLLNPVQTNDVGRSGTLLCGFLYSRLRYPRPMRLLELGTSAGLNLLWDKYRYEWDESDGWGPEDALVRLSSIFKNNPPSWPFTVEIVERAGCDKHPLDPKNPVDQLTLRSYVWADQKERIERLRAACVIACDTEIAIDCATAADWLQRKLLERRPGIMTVIFHSVVWQYLSPSEQAQIEASIVDAGAHASHETPLVWLRMEPVDASGRGAPILRWRGYPEGQDRVLATSTYHAPEVRWFDQS